MIGLPGPPRADGGLSSRPSEPVVPTGRKAGLTTVAAAAQSCSGASDGAGRVVGSCSTSTSASNRTPVRTGQPYGTRVLGRTEYESSRRQGAANTLVTNK